MTGFDGRPMYYDRQGNPIATVLDWGRLHSDLSYKRVEATQVGEYWVSTVWLGLDHSFTDAGPPLIFETMVFHQPGGEQGDTLGADLYMQRYPTEAQARAGHAAVVRAVREGRLDELDDEL